MLQACQLGGFAFGRVGIEVIYGRPDGVKLLLIFSGSFLFIVISPAVYNFVHVMDIHHMNKIVHSWAYDNQSLRAESGRHSGIDPKGGGQRS